MLDPPGWTHGGEVGVLDLLILLDDPDFAPPEVIFCLLDTPALIVGADED